MYLDVASASSNSNSKEIEALLVRSRHEQQRLDSMIMQGLSTTSTLLICQTPIVNHPRAMARTLTQFQSIPSCKQVAEMPIATSSVASGVDVQTSKTFVEEQIEYQVVTATAAVTTSSDDEITTTKTSQVVERFVAALRTHPGIFSKQQYFEQEPEEKSPTKPDIMAISDTDGDDDEEECQKQCQKDEEEDSTESVSSSDDDERDLGYDSESKEEETTQEEEENRRVQLERDRCMEIYKQNSKDERAQVIRSVCEGLISMIDNAISVPCFESEDLPAITIYDYVERLVRYVDAWAKDTASPHSSGIRSALFAVRYLEKFKPGISIRSVHRLYMCAVLAGLKAIEDFRMRNGYWCKVGGVDLQELNRMEIEFCQRMNWQLQLSLGEYESQRRHYVDPYF